MSHWYCTKPEIKRVVSYARPEASLIHQPLHEGEKVRGSDQADQKPTLPPAVVALCTSLKRIAVDLGTSWNE